ncbi:MAG: hypothetical protein A2Y65_07070 [Deltaproteobacteria bacterium RBG_13_52_11]|nr:MAG: hypothetical protein A2Y65_07070 [Deltaproteobacteria bacterium RBG_13_52_11]
MKSKIDFHNFLFPFLGGRDLTAHRQERRGIGFSAFVVTARYITVLGGFKTEGYLGDVLYKYLSMIIMGRGTRPSQG